MSIWLRAGTQLIMLLFMEFVNIFILLSFNEGYVKLKFFSFNKYCLWYIARGYDARKEI